MVGKNIRWMLTLRFYNPTKLLQVVLFSLQVEDKNSDLDPADNCYREQ